MTHAPISGSQPGVEPRPVLILGGSGFIGTALARLLISRDIPIRIGDLRPAPDFPDKWARCDVRDSASLSEITGGAGAIINLAAEHRDDVRPLSRYHETNVEGAMQVCLAARAAGIQRIIFTSSVAVYGFQPVPVDESGPFAPFNPYGQTKFEAEKIYQAWAQEDPARSLIIVRPAVVFGERNRGNVYNLIRQIASGRFFMVGAGDNVKSMAYVGNIAAFLARTLSLPSGVHIFNYVDGPDMNTRDLVEHINRCLHSRRRIPRIPFSVAVACGHAFDLLARVSGRTFPVSAIRVRKFCASTQFRADRVAQLGFFAPYSIQEGLARTIAFEFAEKDGQSLQRTDQQSEMGLERKGDRAA
jgi:nucleoside-diphosphate-sugar epimerase